MNELTLAEVQEIMDKTPDMAFPISRKYDLGDGGTVETLNSGLTKREYFAGLAMQGILAAGKGVMNENGHPVGYPDNIAGGAVKYADALISELSKEEE